MTPDCLATEALRFHVGNGVLIRRRGLAMLIGPGDETTVRELVAAAQSATRSRQPGRQLLPAAVRLLTGDSRPPALCAIGVSNRGAAALVHGAATMTIRSSDGLQRLCGSGSDPMVEREVTGPISAVQAALDAAALQNGAALPDPWCELDAGVVRADAFHIGTGEPVASAPPPTEELLTGVCCRAGHFTDPTLPYCCVCGIGLTQAGQASARRKRPALGVLVVDDGRVLPLDRDHVLGRSPDCPEARAGAVTPVRLDDPLVSDVHARISLDGWQVSIRDADSSRGTYVLEPNASAWQRLRGGRGRPLQPGAVIAVGSRQLRFDTYRVR
jgi:FHA domain